jgi:putative ABC transport system substrate-binding protein
MERRSFIALLSGAASWPLAARAQQKSMPVVGGLFAASPPANLDDLVHGPIHQGMGELGFVEGQNMAWEYRWAEGHYERLPALAADLVSRKVDVIVTSGVAADAAKNATSTIPIVFANVDAGRLVASLARPGGNLTGFSNISGEMQPKRLEILCELVPQATVIALLINPDVIGALHTTLEQYIRLMQEAARTRGVQLPVLKARTEDEIDTAFASLGPTTSWRTRRQPRYVPQQPV